MSKIKAKLQELMAVIKEETAEQSQEVKTDILKTVNDIKQALEEKWQDNLNDVIKELEHKALKVQYTIQDKYSQGIEKKDEVVVKTADALIDAVNKLKKALVKDE